MVDRALQLLSVHIIWKSHNVIQNAGAMEDSELQENLREERDLLLEKLTEYALGTQSNALLSVRRTVRSTIHTILNACTERVNGTYVGISELPHTSNTFLFSS